MTIAQLADSATAFGPAVALSCRECGARIPLGPHYVCVECFGPLEIAYDFHQADRPAVTRELIESGPASIWRYAPLLPVPADVATKPNLNPGWTRLVHARNLGKELGLRSLHVKDDTGNPTHSFKDRVVAIALEAARTFGFTTLSCSSTGNLAGAVGAAAARAGLHSCVFIPADLEQGKIIMAAVYGGELIAIDGTYDEVNRFCSELIGDEAGRGLGLRQREPAALLRRGLQDAGLRDRRAARLAAARADRDPDRLRIAADEDRQGLQGADRARPGRGHGPTRSSARRRTAAPRSRPPSRPGTTWSSRSARTPSPSRSRSATRPTARTCWTSPGAPAAPWRT